jgi:hypothetical protein
LICWNRGCWCHCGCLCWFLRRFLGWLFRWILRRFFGGRRFETEQWCVSAIQANCVLNPIEIIRNSGIHSRKICQTTEFTKGSDSHLCVTSSVATRFEKWTTGVIVTAILAFSSSTNHRGSDYFTVI